MQHVTQWIHDHIAYQPGSSNALTAAPQVLSQRAGVCRDFAHLGITLCRALNIPARLAVGYVRFKEPPQDFHAVFEAWLGSQWVMFDPTGLAPAERLVRVGTGTDAKDVAFATLFGPVQMSRMAVRNFDTGGTHYGSPEKLARALYKQLDPSTVVLVKGSRSMRMERVVEQLAQIGGEDAA